MRYLTFREKIELLNGATRENGADIRQRMTSGRLDMDGERIRAKIDIRKRINDKLEEEGVLKNELVERLGKQRQALSAFLNGRAPLPLSTIEEILWLLEDNNMMAEDYDDTGDNQ